mmetsp:Transcript_48401/g.122038  ORF Transcript_48401/g.122038 Transcript_48401/m.122038 type:complete len:207 (-) Transcript_48401:1401-2021(-)
MEALRAERARVNDPEKRARGLGGCSTHRASSPRTCPCSPGKKSSGRQRSAAGCLRTARPGALQVPPRRWPLSHCPSVPTAPSATRSGKLLPPAPRRGLVPPPLSAQHEALATQARHLWGIAESAHAGKQGRNRLRVFPMPRIFPETAWRPWSRRSHPSHHRDPGTAMQGLQPPPKSSRRARHSGGGRRTAQSAVVGRSASQGSDRH